MSTATDTRTSQPRQPTACAPEPGSDCDPGYVAAWRALSTVNDPELDEPITTLAFVAGLRVTGDSVAAELRLPTFFCAPTFAYLMVADAYDALKAVDGLEHVEVRLIDHFADDQINAGVAEQTGFGGDYGDPSEQGRGELQELRATFWRKAALAASERLAMRLVRDGTPKQELHRVRLGQVPNSRERQQLIARRRDLGLPHDDEAFLVTDEQGAPVTAEKLPLRLRYARATRVSIEGNSGWCRGLLDTRYPDPEAPGAELHREKGEPAGT